MIEYDRLSVEEIIKVIEKERNDAEELHNKLKSDNPRLGFPRGIEFGTIRACDRILDAINKVDL